jgi:triphosphatase
VAAEIELKLALDRSAARRAAELARHPAVAAVRHGRMRTSHLLSTYYDTPDFALEKAGVALRLRRDGARWLQTVKGPPLAEEGGALHARDEYEWPIARPRIDHARLHATPWRKLFRKVRERDELIPLFTTDVLRRSLPLKFADGTTAVLAIDVGAIRARAPAGRRCSICEIEIEIAQGSVEPAYALALALLDAWPLSVATATKAHRGYALAHGEPGEWGAPLHAGYAEFAIDGPADEALAAIAQGCLRQIAGNAAGLLAESDPEWVHQMRIGTRRLRSCMALIESIAGRARVAPLVSEIRWLAEILGAARDRDVLATETLPPLASALAAIPGPAGGVLHLRQRIGGHRTRARKAARTAVASLRFQRLLLAIGALCAAPGFGANERPQISARAFSEKLLTHRHEQLLAKGAALEHATDEERHAVRIAAKKLRYAAEFFSPPEPRKRNRAYLKALARLQDALGHWHDAVVAARLAAEVTRSADDPTLGAVRGWVAAKISDLEPEIAAAWEHFADAKRFWARE